VNLIVKSARPAACDFPTGRANDEREFAIKPGQYFRAGMFEINAAATDGHRIVRAVGQVDNLGGHLRGEAEQVCRPCPLRHYLSFLLSCNGARSLVNIRAQLSAERRIHPGQVIEATPDPTYGSIEGQLREGYVNSGPAGDVEKVLR
jgi:hypothetical protein